MSTVNLLQMVISDYKKHIMNYLLQTTKIYTIHFETLNNLTELRPLHLWANTKSLFLPISTSLTNWLDMSFNCKYLCAEREKHLLNTGNQDTKKIRGKTRLPSQHGAYNISSKESKGIQAKSLNPQRRQE